MTSRGDDAQTMRIRVLSQIDPASPRTNSIADLRFCAGLAQGGHRVELVVPATTRVTPPAVELLARYGLDPSFDVQYLHVGKGLDGRDRIAVLGLLFRHASGPARQSRAEVVISRDVRLLVPYMFVDRLPGRNVLVVPWLHEFRDRRLERLACSAVPVVLATNSAIVADMKRRGITKPGSFLTGNPVPRERVRFGRTCSRADALTPLG